MRALLQRVQSARLMIDGQVHSQCEQGLVVLLGVGPQDTSADVNRICQKFLKLRIFADAQDRMNLSLLDLHQSDADRAETGPAAPTRLMLVSQFTLYADTRKGNRPSFKNFAASPDHARQLYDACVAMCKATLHDRVATGIFGADMQIELVNDGPVTIMLDTQAM